jgi:polyisoprenyl-phosphate glycosyltransferase
MKLNHLSIVVPCYNEEAGVKEFYNRVKRVLCEETSYPFDLIFVDDASKDSTLKILKEIADNDSNVTVISLGRNFGHQAALTAGLDVAQGNIVITMDSDLQHPPDVIPQMLLKYESGYDVVYAIRNIADNISWMKRITSNLFYILINRITDLHIYPGAADFRLMSQEVVIVMRDMRESHRFLRGMVPWIGFNSDFIMYDQPERFAGQPTYTLRRSLKLAIDGLFSFSTIPLTLIIWTGIFVVGTGFIYLLYGTFMYVLGVSVQGWTSIISTMLLLGGIQLISIGVIAKYIGMIFEQVKQRPVYTVKYSRYSEYMQTKK